MRRIVAVVSIFLSVSVAAELPVREIVLYKSGVGFFERSGRLAAGEPARLDFKAPEMDDVLKSLTVIDTTGKVAGLRYDSSEPLSQRLTDFPFQIAGGQSLSAFLDQLKGARIELKYGAETVSGAIVSARTTKGEDKAPDREQLVLLLDSGEIRTLDLAGASSMRFADPALQTALRDYLSALVQARSKDKRSIYIDSSDSKDREISAMYMVPMPVWKSSYRLVFDAQGQATIEGWAIVDNTTGDDWTKVRISVVSGRPVSFISKLYEPKYVQRQTIDLAEQGPANPTLYEPSVAVASNLTAMKPFERRALMAAPAAPAFAADSTQFAQPQSTIVTAADTRDLGELFEYRFASPVTIHRGESAMLPFLQQKLGARKLLIYSETYGLNPMSAAELANSTGKTLDGGPITVFDANNYAGEALIETVKAGDKRLIGYAVDLGTRVTTKFGSSHEFTREIHFRRGELTTRSAIEETKTYSIRNVDQKPKTLIIEHPQRAGYKLVDMKPAETTANAYRFEVKLDPDATQAFPVTEQRVIDTTTSVSSLTPDALFAYVQNKNLPEAARSALQQIAEQKRQIADVDRRLQSAKSEADEAVSDEQRLRENIRGLNGVSGQQDQVQKYARQLSDTELHLASVRDGMSRLKREKSALESALNGTIDKLAF